MTENTTTNNAQGLSKKEKKKAYDKAWQQANKAKVAAAAQAWRLANKAKTAAYTRAWQQANKEAYKEKKAAYNKAWLEANKVKSAANTRAWQRDNREKKAASNRAWHDKQVKSNPLYKAKYVLRNAVCSAFERIKQNKPTDTQTLLGCTWEEAKAHFESLFQEGMSWENHGEWHIDHVRPVASFGPDELDQMNHISNLQPLWAKDNFEKSDTWE